jgi:hypothetical protein
VRIETCTIAATNSSAAALRPSAIVTAASTPSSG